MSVPTHPDFVEILGGLSLHRGQAENIDQPPGISLPNTPAIDENGREIKTIPLSLQCSTKTKISLRSLVKKVQNELEKAGHKNTEAISSVFVAFAVISSKHGVDRVRELNSILEEIDDTDFSQFLISRSELPGYYRFEYGSFTAGPLHIEKIQSRCERADSDFFDRYQASLRGKFTIERGVSKTKTINYINARERAFAKRNLVELSGGDFLELWSEISRCYFSSLNYLLFHDFFREHSAAQAPYVTMGGPFLDIENNNFFLASRQVSIFLNVAQEKNSGWVAPGSIVPMTLDLADAHVRIPKIQKELKRDFEFQGFKNSPLDRNIRLFCEFVLKARRYEAEGILDDAMLNYIIALELIFSDERSIKSSFVDRISVVLSGGELDKFTGQCRQVGELYDDRSKYVHSGMEFESKSKVKELGTICKRVFEVLMRVRTKRKECGEGKEIVEYWLRDLDFISTSMRSGRSVGDRDLEGAGLISSEGLVGP